MRVLASMASSTYSTATATSQSCQVPACPWPAHSLSNDSRPNQGHHHGLRVPSWYYKGPTSNTCEVSTNSARRARVPRMNQSLCAQLAVGSDHIPDITLPACHLQHDLRAIIPHAGQFSILINEMQHADARPHSTRQVISHTGGVCSRRRQTSGREMPHPAAR